MYMKFKGKSLADYDFQEQKVAICWQPKFARLPPPPPPPHSFYGRVILYFIIYQLWVE
jgi:hypothetical protein